MSMRFGEEESESPWGEASFQRDRYWYQHYSSEPGYKSDEYSRVRGLALADPTYDFFSEWLPTGRPKYDIGRYVARQGIPVPLIRSQAEWEHAFATGTAMLRSEMHQDYEGFSGLLDSVVSSLEYTLPASPYDDPMDVISRSSEIERRVDPESWEAHMSLWGGDKMLPRSSLEGPLAAQPTLMRDRYSAVSTHLHSLGSQALREKVDILYTEAVRDGSMDPSEFMHLFVWDKRMQHILGHDGEKRLVNQYGLSQQLSNATASRWRYVPGVNLKVMRDPVIEGKYYVGGNQSYHDWTINTREDVEDIRAHDHHGTFQYELPTQKIIDLYEKVRTLPLFDNRQAPLMELQYGDNGILYFLQYLKTNRLVGDNGAFALPTGDQVVHIHGQVIGATVPEGEKLRLYIEPHILTSRMAGQAIRPRWTETGHKIQVASIAARVVIAEALYFNHGHFDSAPFVRPAVAIGLTHHAFREENNRAKTLLESLAPPFLTASDPRPTSLTYLDTIITSNGREATIESDWQTKTDSIT